MTGAGADAGDASARPAGLEGFIDEVANFWKLTARSSRRLLAGDYTLGDAAVDANAWLSSSASYVVGVADRLWGEAAPLSTYDGIWSATMTVIPSERPLTLRTSGLRAIGAQTIEVPPSAITFDPPVVPEGVDTFDIRVSMVAMQGQKTLIFQGEIKADETTELITDPVRANNRDGGPVR